MLAIQSSALRRLFLFHKGGLRFKGVNRNPGYIMLCYKVHEGHSLMQLGGDSSSPLQPEIISLNMTHAAADKK